MRVAKSHLENYTGRSVRLVGKVISNDGAAAVLEDAEGAQVDPTSPARRTDAHRRRRPWPCGGWGGRLWFGAQNQTLPPLRRCRLAT